MSKRANLRMASEALATLPYGDMARVIADAIACRKDADAAVTHHLANSLSRHADDLQRDQQCAPADYSVQAPTGGDSAREGRPCAQSFPRDLGIGAATEMKRGY
jgi:hypothetical protein